MKASMESMGREANIAPISELLLEISDINTTNIAVMKTLTM
jgi:hypothetical protein